MSLDINKLLDEVEADVKKLLKSAQEDAEGLKKAEESKAEASKKEESKKEESKKEDKKEQSKADSEKSAMAKADKQEGSGYESQAPEASEAPAADEAAAPAAEGDQAEDLASVMQGLDDDTLHELYQKIKMELMARMQSQEDSAAHASAAHTAETSAAAPDLAMKSEKESIEKLTKAESELKTKDEEISKLKKSLEDYERGLSEMTDMLKQVLERPVQRALTDISFIAKDGTEGLKKSEMSDEDIKKAVDAISSDRKKLSALNKSEIDTIQDFYAGKNVKDKILKIVNK